MKQFDTNFPAIGQAPEPGRHKPDVHNLLENLKCANVAKKVATRPHKSPAVDSDRSVERDGDMRNVSLTFDAFLSKPGVMLDKLQMGQTLRLI